MIYQIFCTIQFKKWVVRQISLMCVNMFGNTTNRNSLIREICFILGNMIYGGRLQS